jgi:hypothetical protein
MRDQLEELATEVENMSERVGDLVFEALRTQATDEDQAEGARELERELARVRRSLAKAEQILRTLARG